MTRKDTQNKKQSIQTTFNRVSVSNVYYEIKSFCADLILQTQVVYYSEEILLKLLMLFSLFIANIHSLGRYVFFLLMCKSDNYLCYLSDWF